MKDKSFEKGDPTQRYQYKYLLAAITLDCLLILPIVIQAYIRGSVPTAITGTVLILVLLLNSVCCRFHILKNRGRAILILVYSIIWVVHFIIFTPSNESLLFFAIYPILSMVILRYQYALSTSILMIILFGAKYLSLDNPLVVRIIVFYLLELTTIFFWKINNSATLKAINKLNFHDRLTGIGNRNYLNIFLEELIPQCRENGERFSLLIIDIDNFKKIHDMPGHRKGNRILTETIDRIKLYLDSPDNIFRLDSDEFVVVLTSVEDQYSPAMTANRILNDKIIGKSLPSVSIGISSYPDEGESVESLVQKGENALYKAKKNGKNTFSFYHKDFNDMVEQRILMESELMGALKRNEFSLVFQPKIDTRLGKVTGAEALIRWNNRLLGPVSPTEFISLAEESDLIHKISTWVYREAFSTLARLKEEGDKNIIISVNVSPLQISKGTLINSLDEAIQYSGISPDSIELEITEGLLLQSNEVSKETLSYLRGKGYKIAIDDFGTGYSSLSYIQRMNLDSIKIDQSFIRNIDKRGGQSIIRAIISIAKSLDIETVAEGVETREELTILEEMGCDIIQGFYYSSPLCIKDFRARLLNQRESTPV